MAKKKAVVGKAFVIDVPPRDLSVKVTPLAKAEAYTVTRITAGGDIVHQMDGKQNLFIPGVKDPQEADPHTPAYMTDGERALYPEGITWSAVLDKKTVASLREDPRIAAHFNFVPVGD